MRLFKTPRFIPWIYPRRTWGFLPSPDSIYLTFDDGPHPEITPFVLDELKKRNMQAAFFCVGENVKKYPEIFQRILAEGHQVGNHTMRHENANKVSAEAYLSSIQEASQWIPSKLFRPPYGRLSPALARKISKNYQIIMWTWLSYDFDMRLSVSAILQKAEQIKPGDILVLHDNAKLKEKQRELLPLFLDLLISKGLETSVKF